MVYRVSHLAPFLLLFLYKQADFEKQHTLNYFYVYCRYEVDTLHSAVVAKYKYLYMITINIKGNFPGLKTRKGTTKNIKHILIAYLPRYRALTKK